MKKDHLGFIISLRNQAATGVWSAWRDRKVGGIISAGVRSVGTSDAVTVRRYTQIALDWFNTRS
jgi:hypothetical protein